MGMLKKTHWLLLLTLVSVSCTGLAAMAQENSEAGNDVVTGAEWVLIGIAVIALLLLVGFAIRSAFFPQNDFIRTLGPSFFFCLGMFYLGLLLLGGVLQVRGLYGFKFPVLIAGVLPIAVPWFGALGAVTISLQGVFDFNDQWDSKFNYWHIGRPIFGAVLGMVAFFLFVVIVSASGSTPSFDGTKIYERFIYYVLAFVIGYREATFRELLTRATDLILKPGEPATENATPGVTFKMAGTPQTVIDFGNVPQGAGDHTIPFEIHNTGTAILAEPSVQFSGADVFKIEAVEGTDSGDLAPGQFSSFKISFVPTAAQQFNGKVSVTSASLSAAKTIDVSGSGTEA